MPQPIAAVLRATGALIVMLLGLAALPALAQQVPNAFTQAVLIKTTLLTFNDANVTGNYDVLHAKAAAPFRKEFTPQEIGDGFNAFREQEIDIQAIAVADYVEDVAPVVEDGELTLAGHYALNPGTVRYRLRFMIDDGVWRMIGINVDVKGGE